MPCWCTRTGDEPKLYTFISILKRKGKQKIQKRSKWRWWMIAFAKRNGKPRVVRQRESGGGRYPAEMAIDETDGWPVGRRLSCFLSKQEQRGRWIPNVKNCHPPRDMDKPVFLNSEMNGSGWIHDCMLLLFCSRLDSQRREREIATKKKKNSLMNKLHFWQHHRWKEDWFCFCVKTNLDPRQSCFGICQK